MAAFMTSTVSNGTSNRHLAGEEYDYILEEEERERRGSNSSGGSGSSSRRTGGNGGPSPLGNSDDLARTSQMLSKLARVAEAGFNAKSRDREATGRGKHRTKSQDGLPAEEKTPDNMVRMVLCGREFQVLASTLKHSGSMVLQVLEPSDECEFFMPDMSKRLGQQCYYFGSRPSAFEAIIMFLEQGKLHAPTDMSLDAWLEELLFYQIKGIDDAIGQRRTEDTDDGEDGKKHVPVRKRSKTKEEMTSWEKTKALIWAITDGDSDSPTDPDSPTLPEIEDEDPIVAPRYASEIWTYFSMTILLASVVLLCVETLPQYREKFQQDCMFPNSTTYPGCAGWWNNRENQGSINFTDLSHTNCTCVQSRVEAQDNNIYVTEAVFVVWFTIELVLRFLVCPDKIDFVKGLLNIIDLLAILPFYIALGAPDSTGGLDSIRILRLFRVFRIFKLSRHSAGLQIFAMALYRSRSILGQLFVFVMTVSILFSAMIFYCEYKNEDSEYGYFSSIPQSMWWAIVTMTTLGYGDMVPQTALGQVVGSACALSGILVVSLPIPVFVENFQRLWNAQYLKKKHGKHKKQQMLLTGTGKARKISADVGSASTVDNDLQEQETSIPALDSVHNATSSGSIVVSAPVTVQPAGALGTIKSDQVSIETTV